MPKQPRKRASKPLRDTPEPHQSGKLTALMTPAALQLLPGSGAGLIQQIGLDVIREIILDVLMGKNIRDSTEALTRSRISALNMAIVHLFIKGSAASNDFVNTLPQLAAEILADSNVAKSERWLAHWMLGLTDKGVQNILRDDKTAYKDYSDLYIQICNEIIDTNKQAYGDLTGYLKIGSDGEVPIDWLFITYLLNAIGAETLTIRGSTKSSIGKLFEKLILGSLLTILGFRYEHTHQIGERIFWLSTRDEHRESDATLLYALGQGVRFDIGFIGRGNSEISLDKVTRYQHEQKLQDIPFYMSTIIIVDRIGARSNIIELARTVRGHIIQMSATYWPQQVARLLRDLFGFSHALIEMAPNQIEAYLKEQLTQITLESFFGNVPMDNPLEEQNVENEQLSLFTGDEENIVEEDSSDL